MKDAEYMEEELNTPEDTILWLWRKHNSVNYRLKDDITADPEHPKVNTLHQYRNILSSQNV